MEENNQKAVNDGDAPAAGEGILNKVGLEAPREVSAATVGRMLGLATISDLKLLDSKIDLLATKITGMTLKVDKALTILASAANASDLERIDVQIGSLKTIIRDAMQTLKDNEATKH